MSFSVRTVQSSADRDGQLELRYRVLREPLGLPKSASAFAGDDAPETIHLIAVADDGAVIGCVTLLADGDALQLRGMAVDDSWHGKGVGRAILDAVYAEAKGRALWCNARLTAEPFYSKCGWESEGDGFDVPGVGPHVVMRWAGDSK